ncbi:OprD family outer membrane porin, partial [Candidatus Dependentiae bacterium]|nr:OprD family outer membrane porin [Candidatus Dependentiae bacterium]
MKMKKIMIIVFFVFFNNLFLIHFLLGSELSDYISLNGEARSYFFSGNYSGKTLTRQDFSIGGKLSMEIKNKANNINLGLTGYTSQGLGLNSDNKAVYGLLGKNTDNTHKNYTVLGEIYLLMKYKKYSFKIGRQEINTPWLNIHDSRMTPYTYEAVYGAYTSEKNIFILSYVDKIKNKNETDFISFPKRLGLTEEHKPFYIAGIKNSNYLKTELWYYMLEDVWSDYYCSFQKSLKYADKINSFHEIRYLRRLDEGDRIYGRINTYMFGIINTFKYLDHSFGITYSSIGNNNLDRLWGHSAAISVQIESVDDAKETGWQFSYGYDMKNFTNLNLNFKSLYAFFDRPDSLGNDKEEFNLEINY